MGGGVRTRKIPFDCVKQCTVISGTLLNLYSGDFVRFERFVVPDELPIVCDATSVILRIPFAILRDHLPIKFLALVGRQHSIHSARHRHAHDVISLSQAHACSTGCPDHLVYLTRPEHSAVNPFNRASWTTPTHSVFVFPSSTDFPPCPPLLRTQMEIIRSWTSAVTLGALREVTCAVCGELVSATLAQLIDIDDHRLSVLERTDSLVTVAERRAIQSPFVSLAGPIICNAGITTVGSKPHVQVCTTCLQCVNNNRLPAKSLANGLWVGDIPEQLSNLTYIEKLMIARYRHNVFVVRVHLGQRRMRANAVAFSQPVAKFHKILPPSLTEMDECLAVLFTGPCLPTAADYKRTPLLIRRDRVLSALEWLKLNHIQYSDLEISYENLQSYPEDVPPVVVMFRPDTGNSSTDPAESRPVFDDGDEKGAESGPCPFSVHAVPAQQLPEMSKTELIAAALAHMRKGHKVLAYNHAPQPESIYHNPLLFPGMFPWLFPYGRGGFENTLIKTRLGRSEHIKHLLIYHDRRFEKDDYFPFVLYSHDQIRGAATGGFLLTERRNFSVVAEKILSVNVDTLEQLIIRGRKNGFVRPVTDDERQCFELLSLIDHASTHSPNTLVHKKIQRNHIKSLIYHLGTPVFFITFSPADIKNPICLYYAGENVDISNLIPDMPLPEDCLRSIAANPIAGARFFDLMMRLFVEHVLRWDTNTDGLFGPTAGYYSGTEAQGRQTMHGHMVVWIKGSVPPQLMRDRVLAGDDSFKQSLISWLEACHQSHFCNGSMSEVASASHSEYYATHNVNSIFPMPPPPVPCSDTDIEHYMKSVYDDVDQLVLKNHIHRCGDHCMRNGSCRARFPREMIPESFFDEQGALHLKQGERWLNMFAILMTYLLRCNTDVSSLLSGTQVRAIIAYVTEYMTKLQLKTYTLFEIIRTVIDQSAHVISGSEDRAQAAKRLITKIVNALNAKMEVGGPMLCSHLLGFPEYYTGHSFVPFYWYPYIRLVANSWSVHMGSDENTPQKDSVRIDMADEHVIAHTRINDYIYRPSKYDNFSLYDFTLGTEIMRLRRAHSQHATNGDNDCDEYESSDSDNEQHSNVPPSQCRTGYMFKEGHPNRASHRVYDRRSLQNTVLDFIGPSLPRKDTGSDLYYLAMLAIFRPGGWRSALDFKAPEVPWIEAYNSASFSANSIAIMANMNLLYECLDARDDYAAMRRSQAGKTDGDFRVPALDNNELNALDIAHIQDAIGEAVTSTTDDILSSSETVGLHGKSARVNSQMLEMKLYLDFINSQYDHSGDPGGSIMSDSVAVEISDYGSLQERDALEWKAIIQAAKERSIHDISTDTTSDVNMFDRAIGNNSVCIIDPTSCNLLSHNDYIHGELSNTLSSSLLDPLMTYICAHFTLNGEQLRAFVTVARQVVSIDGKLKPVSMFLSGMGGTGKSLVIRSLITFFEHRQERHRFMVMAPTGSAASLIHGSTYHSVLQFGRGNQPASSRVLSQVRNRLAGVDLLFIDEISMVSCHDLHRISARLCEVFNTYDKPFGGLHVVLAGDFCQLPPAGMYAVPLYASSPTNSNSNPSQKTVLGRAVWHQFTTIVILRKNMRQLGDSEEEEEFRNALTRIRTCDASEADVALITSRIVNCSSHLPHLLSPQFRDISIITAWNSHRDAINELSAERFAASRGKTLTYFYSRDTWTASSAPGPSRVIDAHTQQQLWAIHPCLADNFMAGKLPLCIGMPVMLKHNDATELCMTNGAEATVIDWHCDQTPSGKQVLNTLFVKLESPPRDVQLDGLPLNVVPIVSRQENIHVTLNNGTQISINREQVPVLLNFAMTDYCSQGRTRPFNPVDLRRCKNHQSMYTCLSRCSSIHGLLVLQPFDPEKIKKGISPDLKNELHELELLDEISKLQFGNELPSFVSGVTRSDLLTSFLRWKGKDYRTEYERVADCSCDRSNQITSFGNKAAPTATDHAQVVNGPQRSTMPIQPAMLRLPGLPWDATNHSCAYDALLTIVINCHQCYPNMWKSATQHNKLFGYLMKELTADASTFTSQSQHEIARNNLRDILYSIDKTRFPRLGSAMTDISDVLTSITTLSQPYASTKSVCTLCSWVAPTVDVSTNTLWNVSDMEIRSCNEIVHASAAHFFRSFIVSPPKQTCPHCCIPHSVAPSVEIHYPPSFLMLQIPVESDNLCTIDPSFELDLSCGSTLWLLSGVVYLGGGHFTSRFIDDLGNVWYHDGIETGSVCQLEAATFSDLPSLNHAKDRIACILIYRNSSSTDSHTMQL